jgi:hypothetical protein
MKKNKRRKSRSKVPIHKELAPYPPPRIPTHIITNINRFTSMGALLLWISSIFYFERIMNTSSGVFWASGSIYIVLNVVKMGIYQTSGIFSAIGVEPVIPVKFRRYIVCGFALNIFMVVVGAMPFLHTFGVINVLANWFQKLLPGKPHISNRLAIAIAFILGAMFSGVVGNFTYDLLKLGYKKIRDKSSTRRH